MCQPVAGLAGSAAARALHDDLQSPGPRRTIAGGARSRLIREGANRPPPRGETVDVTDHPFLNVIWTFFLIFVWVAWFWLLITIAIDIFRRHDMGGIGKAIW